MIETRNQWTFIIDTDDYSGNFHREMAGYVVGHIYDGHGEEESAIFLKECGQELADEVYEFLTERSLEHDGIGYMANNEMTRTREGKYEAVAIFLRDKPTDEILNLMVDRAKKFCEWYKKETEGSYDIKILGFRLIREETTVHEEWASE